MDVENQRYFLAMFAYCLGSYFFLKRFSHHIWSYLLVGTLYVPFFTVGAYFMRGQPGFHIVELCSYGMFLFGSILLTICTIVCWDKFKVLRVFFLGLNVILMAVALESFVIEPHWLSVRHETMSSSKLKKPLKIAVLADIQTDAMSDYEKDVFKRVKQYQPDIILFAGDYIQLYDEGRAHQVELFNKLLKEVDLQAPLGAYAVRGDVDQIPNWDACFEGLPVKTFDDNATIKIGELQLTVLNLDASRNATYSIPQVDSFHIVLGHAPDYALKYPKADLLVAGHTHGGQVQLPFFGPLMTMSAVPRNWGGGCMTDIGAGTMLCISRGIGMERQRAPRIRFICRPELVFIDVLPAPSAP